MSEQVDNMDGFEDGPELTKQELVEALWRCENDLAHQRELVRKLAEKIAREDGWVEDSPSGDRMVMDAIAWAEARVAGKDGK